MNTTGIEQVTYLQFLEVPSLPTPSQRLKNVEVVLRADGRKYRCTGIAWVDASGTASVGSLDAASPIAGNPAGLQTPGQLASTIQAQAAQIAALQAAMATKLGASVFDKDGDNRLDVDALDDLEIPFTNPSTTWNYTHNLGRIPQVTVIDENGNEFDADPQFPDLNNITIEFITPKTGKLILH